MSSNHISGAEIVIRCLHEEKVKFVFGYPGGAVLNIYDAVFQQNKFSISLSRVYIGKGYAITPATATVTTYLPWPPWAARQR